MVNNSNLLIWNSAQTMKLVKRFYLLAKLSNSVEVGRMLELGFRPPSGWVEPVVTGEQKSINFPRDRMMEKHFSAVGLDRRQFFKWTMTGALAAALPVVGWGRNAPEKWPPRTEKAKAVYRRLHGPQAAITIPFRENFEVDYDALREWTEFMCEADPPILFFTYGDGEIDVLTEEEIARVNLTVLQQAKGRTLVVGATGPWWTGRMVDFVKRMEDAGLEAINLHFSHRILQEAQLFSAYERIAAETTIPLLIYDSQLPTSAILKLASFPQVAGVKSHAGLYPFYDQARETRETDFAVLGAGQMKQFLYGAQVGSP